MPCGTRRRQCGRWRGWCRACRRATARASSSRASSARDAWPRSIRSCCLTRFRSDAGADYIAGFPDHPHRGFETVTYVLAGRMRHGDNNGNSGLLEPGSVQWMTAGRGIVHSEMPEQENGLMWGFQLWVNLPAKDKMIAPRYQDIRARAHARGGARRAAARCACSPAVSPACTGPVEGIVTEPLLLDVAVPAGRRRRRAAAARPQRLRLCVRGRGRSRRSPRRRCRAARPRCWARATRRSFGGGRRRRGCCWRRRGRWASRWRAMGPS